MPDRISASESARKSEFQRLAELVDTELAADSRFFLDNPSRTCRIRRTFPNELRLKQLANQLRVPAGHRCFTMVRQVGPGRRVRQFYVARRGFMPPTTNMGSMRMWREITAG